MEILASRIARELKGSNHCAVYEEELSRVWPPPDKDREEKIKRFARQKGLHVPFYKEGLCAIFIRDSQRDSFGRWFNDPRARRKC
jgi:hypothetical protein